jgi:hypothetical protein
VVVILSDFFDFFLDFCAQISPGFCMLPDMLRPTGVAVSACLADLWKLAKQGLLPKKELRLLT